MSKFPKVLVLATSRHTHGGVSTVLLAHEQTAEWHRYGCRWIATHRSGPKAVKLLYLFSGLGRYLLRLPRCKVVHAHIGEAPSAIRKRIFLNLAKKIGKKTVVHVHVFDTESTIYGAHGDVYKNLFDMADKVVVLSEIWKKALVDFGVQADKVEVIYNPCIKKNAVAYSASAHARTILAAGVLSARKGYADLIKAFAKVAGAHPGWRLVFAGSGEIGQGKALAESLGIADRVDFPGWVAGDYKDRLFREASVLCLASYAEGFPMAVLDAWSYGLPVVATPVGSLPEFARDGEDILFFLPAISVRSPPASTA